MTKARFPGLRAEAQFTPACPELPSHPPLDTDPTHPLVINCLELASSVAGMDPQPKGVPFWSDAALFNHLKGVPSIVFGPGNIGVAHSNGEFVPVEELLSATRINAGLALSLLS